MAVVRATYVRVYARETIQFNKAQVSPRTPLPFAAVCASPHLEGLGLGGVGRVVSKLTPVRASRDMDERPRSVAALAERARTESNSSEAAATRMAAGVGGRVVKRRSP